MKCPGCSMSVGDIHGPNCALFIPLTAVTEEHCTTEVNTVSVVDDTPTNGDCYDEDTGEYLGQLESGLQEGTVTIDKSIPVQISMYVNGYWYIFRPSHKCKYEEEVKDGKSESKA